MGSEVLVLGFGALLVGWLLGLLTTRRRVLAAPVPAPAQNRFADRQMTLRETDGIATPPVRDTQLELPADPIPDHTSAPVPSVFNDMDFEQSALLLDDSESVLGLFQDVAHARGSQTATPSSLLQAGVDVREPVVVHGFDSAAAANEVERVRKSLANKRDTRARQREQEISVQSALQAVGWSSGGLPDVVWDRSAYPVMQGVECDELFDRVDLPLDLPDEGVAEAKLFVPDACVADLEEPEIVELDALKLELPDDESERPVLEDQPSAQTGQLALAPVERPVEPEPDFISEVIAKEVPGPEAQPDAVVQLELALEFESLRLLDGAREIAQEVLESSDDELRRKAKALVAKLDVLESEQHADALVDDAIQ